MAKISKPASKQLVDPDTGHIKQEWESFLGRASDAISGPFPLRQFTLATLPDAAKHPSGIVHATDAGGPKGLPLISTDGHWYDFQGNLIA